LARRNVNGATLPGQVVSNNDRGGEPPAYRNGLEISARAPQVRCGYL